MMRRVIHRISNASTLAFDPAARLILYTTLMYDENAGAYKDRTITINEGEWAAIVEYGNRGKIFKQEVETWTRSSRAK